MRLSRSTLILFLSLSLTTFAQKATSPPFDTTPFNVNVAQLPGHYLGHSLVPLIAALSRWKRIAGKGEFETTVDYQQRLANHRQALLFGRIRFNDLMAFSIGPSDNGQLTSKYEADLGILTVTLKLDRDVLNDNRDDPVYTATWVDTSHTYGSYVGRNVFNRAVRVKVVRADHFSLGISASALEDFAELNQGDSKIGSTIFYAYEKLCNVALNIGPVEAREVKPRLRALIIGYLSENPYSYTSDHDTPTISDPYDYYSHRYLIKVVPQEIWIYDFSSGLIYSKITSSPKDQEQSEPIRDKTGKPIDYARTFTTNEVNVKARILSRPEPQYTEEARKNQVSGTVVLRAVFSSSGQVTNIRAVSGLPNGLTERAIAAARQIRFTPAMKDGRAVSQYIQIEYNFNLY